MLENEKRYRISAEERDRLLMLTKLTWSNPGRVTDLTFGLSGATSMQTHGWVIRVRMKEKRTSIQYKAPANDDWTAWEEISTDVDNLASSIKILQKIGLTPGLVIDRERREAFFNGFKLTLDRLFLLGDFLEIEQSNENIIKESTFNGIAESLGVDCSEEARPYGELMLNILTENPNAKFEVDRFIMKIVGGTENA